METLAGFLRRLLHEGQVVFRDRPVAADADRHEAVAVLEGAHAVEQLHLAGPPLAFHAGAGLAAAELVRLAAWYTVSRAETDAEMERTLVLPRPPRRPEQHLSADLVLRYLPQIHGRARALNPADRLTTLLADVLRQWPLSGVLSDVALGPATPLDFGGHAGLLLLYGERLARNMKPAWVPMQPGRAYFELVWQELGKDAATLPAAAIPPTGAATERE